MTNVETDKLAMVKMVSARDVPGLFKRTLTSNDGFSIEVFRGDRHHGSIMAKGTALTGNTLKQYESLDIRRSDLLYQVNLGRKLFTLEGTFATRDNPPLHPRYKVACELAVVSPAQFILRYRQQNDPVRIALAALEGELRRYASLRCYNQLKNDELKYRVEHTLNAGNNKTLGLDVVCVHDVLLFEDPHEQKKREVIQEKEIERTGVVEGLKTEALKSDFARTERSQDDEERWARERREEAEKRLKERLDGLSTVYIQEERNRIKDLLDTAKTLPEIEEIYPSLSQAFPSLAHQEQRSLKQQKRLEMESTTKNLNDAALDGEVDVDIASPRGTARRKIEALSLDHLGFTLLPTTLTPGQRTSVGIPKGLAFLVTMVDDAGKAEMAGLSIGDVVVGINEEAVTDADMLADTLKLRDHTGKISLRVLRGKQLISLLLDALD